MEQKYFHDGKYWDKKEIFDEAQRFLTSPPRRVTEAIRMVEGGRVLDLGSGWGVTSYLAAKKLAGRGEVIGVERLEGDVAIAKEKFQLPNLKFMAGDITELNFPEGSFDCVMLLEVIEHIEEPAAFIRYINKLLRKNGSFVISTPNAACTDTFFQNLKPIRRSMEMIDNEKGGSGTELDHVYTWTVPMLYRLLNKCGFRYDRHAFSGAGFPFTTIDRFAKTSFSNWLGPVYGKFGINIIMRVRKA